MVALAMQERGRAREGVAGAGAYVAEDVRVRDAVLEALLNDSDPRIRTEAIIFWDRWSGSSVPGSAAHGGQFRPEPTDPDRFEQVLRRAPEIQ